MIRRGFTLIELLVVITILAILAGAALPYVQNYVAESRIAKAKTDLEEIARALAVYETREGDYPDTGTVTNDGKSDVSQLTGRYLNKAPIDPWGAQYIIDINGGIVYSMGPDRSDLAPDGKYDNIVTPYQPPLAMVSAKWVDKNQTGAVDTKNVNDELHLTFSRKLISTSNETTIAGVISIISNTSPVVTTDLTNIVVAASGFIVSDRTIVYPINNTANFVAGRDALSVKDNQTSIEDRATPANRCISSQNVVILPQ